MALASSPAAAPPMPSATMKSDPRGPDLVAADFGLQAGVAGAQIGDEEGVLVVIAGAAEIGLAEDGHAHRRRMVTRASALRKVPLGMAESCDESRKALESVNVRLGVSHSHCVPCSHGLSLAHPAGRSGSCCGAGLLLAIRSPRPAPRTRDMPAIPAGDRVVTARSCLRCRRRAGSARAPGSLSARPDAVVRARGFQLPVRLRRRPEDHGHDQRPPGAGLAQRRLAGLDSVSARHPDAVHDRGTRRPRLRRCWSIAVRRDRALPREVSRAGRGSTRCRFRPGPGVVARRNEYLTLSARAAEGAEVRVRLPDGTVVRLLPQKQSEEVSRRCGPSTATRPSCAHRKRCGT